MDWGSGSTTPLTAGEGCPGMASQMPTTLGCSAAGDAAGLDTLRGCKTDADVATCGAGAMGGVSAGCSACLGIAAASAGMTDPASLTPEIIVRTHCKAQLRPSYE